MMKLFRVHHVHANGLETLALTVSAGGLKRGQAGARAPLDPAAKWDLLHL